MIRNRLEFNEVDASLNTDISLKHTTVITIHGDMPQLNATKDEIELYNNNRINFRKFSTASSYLEASCNKISIFKIMKDELPKYTV